MKLDCINAIRFSPFRGSQSCLWIMVPLVIASSSVQSELLWSNKVIKLRLPARIWFEFISGDQSVCCAKCNHYFHGWFNWVLEGVNVPSSHHFVPILLLFATAPVYHHSICCKVWFWWVSHQFCYVLSFSLGLMLSIRNCIPFVNCVLSAFVEFGGLSIFEFSLPF